MKEKYLMNELLFFQPCTFQLRLDFTTFSIAGPSTATTSTAMILNGIAIDVLAVNAVPASVATRCLLDSFAVTNAAGRSSDIICGVNTGQHSESETFSITELTKHLLDMV